MRQENRERQPHPELDPTLLKAFSGTFLATYEYFPQQQSDGSYRAIYAPFTLDLIEKHLRGQITIGAYALDRLNQAKWLCFDADEPSQWEELKTLARKLSDQAHASYMEKSRRGGHLWLFFSELLTGQEVRRFGRHLLADNNLTIKEIYPRQDELATGVGSLVRLPLGIYRKSGNRYGFVTVEEQPIAPTAREQLKYVANPDRISADYVRSVVAALPKERPKPVPKELRRLYAGNSKILSERIKETVTVREFVSQFVDLDERGRGLCPFHDDHRQSFGVNDEHNFWGCFAQCGNKPYGGSIIHFWQKWRRERYGLDGDFIPTITELAKILKL